MIYQLRNNASRIWPAILLLGALLFAQMSTIEHSIEHASHDSNELCASFIALENSSAAIKTIHLFKPFLPPCIQHTEIQPFPPSSLIASYHSRAPPKSA